MTSFNIAVLPGDYIGPEITAEARRVLYPCHNYKHAPVVKTVRRVLESEFSFGEDVELTCFTPR